MSLNLDKNLNKSKVQVNKTKLIVKFPICWQC